MEKRRFNRRRFALINTGAIFENRTRSSRFVRTNDTVWKKKIDYEIDKRGFPVSVDHLITIIVCNDGLVRPPLTRSICLAATDNHPAKRIPTPARRNVLLF